MLDNLREDAAASPFFDEDDELPDFLEDGGEDQEARKPKSDPFAFLQPIMVLTPVQRFVIAALLFTAVCIIGSMSLLVMDKFSVF